MPIDLKQKLRLLPLGSTRKRLNSIQLYPDRTWRNINTMGIYLANRNAVGCSESQRRVNAAIDAILRALQTVTRAKRQELSYSVNFKTEEDTARRQNPTGCYLSYSHHTDTTGTPQKVENLE